MLDDALAGSSPLLTEEEIRVTLADLKAELKRKQSAAGAEKELAANRLAEPLLFEVELRSTGGTVAEGRSVRTGRGFSDERYRLPDPDSVTECEEGDGCA